VKLIDDLPIETANQLQSQVVLGPHRPIRPVVQPDQAKRPTIPTQPVVADGVKRGFVRIGGSWKADERPRGGSLGDG